MKIDFSDFEKIAIRIGTILEAEAFKQARKPAYILKIDFGEEGVKKSSAQITERYKPKDLIGRQVVAVTNFPPKQIANIMSECLVLGVAGEEGVSLLSVDHPLPNGSKIS